MSIPRLYCVLLLPEMEIAQTGCSLQEAEAWIRAYNEIMSESGREAAIVQSRRRVETGKPAGRKTPIRLSRRGYARTTDGFSTGICLR